MAYAFIAVLKSVKVSGSFVFAICLVLGSYGTFVGLPLRFSSFQTQKDADCFSASGIFTKFTGIRNVSFQGKAVQ